MKSIALLLGLFLTALFGCNNDPMKGEEEEPEQQSPVITTPPSSDLDKNPGRPDTVRPGETTD